MYREQAFPLICKALRAAVKKLCVKQFCNIKSVDMPYLVCDNELHTKCMEFERGGSRLCSFRSKKARGS